MLNINVNRDATHYISHNVGRIIFIEACMHSVAFCMADDILGENDPVTEID